MITVAFSTHRLEVLMEAEARMRAHEAVALEEPPHPLFQAMLCGEVAVENYLQETDYEFPRFAEASCRLYRRLHASGKRLIQVDPYMEHLERLHDFFAQGGEPQAVDPADPMHAVYRAERRATAALMHFYEMSMTAPFSEVVRAVIHFARTDAARIALRDEMRARRLAVEAKNVSTLYVESGYIHWKLFRDLRRSVEPDRPVRPCFLLEREARRRLGRKQVLGPGDTLTLLFIFQPGIRGAAVEMMAARSLIYIKLLHKDELEPVEGAYPHLDDEVLAYRLTRLLSWADCEKLYPEIRTRPAEEVQEIVKTHVARQTARGWIP
ncbi:MAG: hypothetical protein WHS86_02495 [Desulfosoma sp.]